jgi:hypothetical protein
MTGLFVLVGRLRWCLFAGLAGVALLSATPAAAQGSCMSGGAIQVEFLGVGTSNTIIMEQIDGAFQGDVLVKVYCSLDGSPIPNAQISMETTVPNSFVSYPSGSPWQPATDPSAATMVLLSGQGQVTIRSNDPGLNGWKAVVGATTVTVTGVGGQVFAASDYPSAGGKIWAQTPELGSIALFGAGAAGMAGYALARLRQRRRA